MIDFNSSWVILPNPLGIHNAGYSYSAYDDDDDDDDDDDGFSVGDGWLLLLLLR